MALPEDGVGLVLVLGLRDAGIRLPEGITRFRELTAALRQVLGERNAHV